MTTPNTQTTTKAAKAIPGIPSSSIAERTSTAPKADK